MRSSSLSNKTELYKEILLNIIAQELPMARVILFGSRARGDHQEGADIDIALDNNTKIDPGIIFEIKGLIEDSNLPVFCDVVDMHAISNCMREKILTDGVIWKN